MRHDARKEMYIADLGAPRYVESIRCDATGYCTLERFGRDIATFIASPGQLKKIKTQRGKLRITQGMVDRAALLRSVYGR